MTRKAKSKAWMSQHVSDPYVLRAVAQGYRSRAAFKLLEIDARERLLRPGMRVVDLGAAPGGWSQVIATRVGPHGYVLAVDLLPVEPISGVRVIEGDFRQDRVLAQVGEILGGRPVDLVVSDMAPNLSGVAASDQAQSIHLGELALEFCRLYLKDEGALLLKAFQGTGYTALLAALRQVFETVSSRKPGASRPKSAEMYLVAKGFRARKATGS